MIGTLGEYSKSGLLALLARIAIREKAEARMSAAVSAML